VTARSQRVDVVPVTGPSRLGTGKKSVHANQLDTPRVRAQRRAYLEALATEDVSRFKFVDETGTHLGYTRRYGCAQPGQRVGQGVPLRSRSNVKVVGALIRKGLEAVMELDGALPGS